VQTLPSDLREALDEMEKDNLIHETLGSHVYQRFLEAKRQEWDDYRIRVSGWEIDRYLHVF
jgi:glutamine synthetase